MLTLRCFILLVTICSKTPHESEHEWTRVNTNDYEWTRVRTRVKHEWLRVNTSQNTSEHEWLRVNTSDYELEHEWLRLNTSEHKSKYREHESKIVKKIRNNAEIFIYLKSNKFCSPFLHHEALPSLNAVSIPITLNTTNTIIVGYFNVIISHKFNGIN